MTAPIPTRHKILVSNGELIVVTIWHVIRRKTAGKRIAGTCSCADWKLSPLPDCPLKRTHADVRALEAFQ